ncbi:MAG: PD-(D/E)XK nuclease family protein, partial [Planctomycetota bacterium]|nr:PD-(D/E)XK nuclease family protein [Planctomycetota bacterium]
SEKVLFQCGDEDWYLSQPPKKEKGGACISLPEKVTLKPFASSIRLDFKSPSAMEGGSLVGASQLLQVSNRRALDRGTIIHGLFEEIVWSGQTLTEDGLLIKAEQLGNGQADPQVQVDDFRKMLAQEMVQRVLSPSYYLEPTDEGVKQAIPAGIHSSSLRLEVHNERRFVVSDSGAMLSGAIDRLVLIYDNDQLLAVDIVDFKTDKIDADDPAAIEQRALHYKPQIEAYRRAVSTMFKLDLERICGRLVFVCGGVVHGFSSKKTPSPA